MTKGILVGEYWLMPGLPHFKMDCMVIRNKPGAPSREMPSQRASFFVIIIVTLLCIGLPFSGKGQEHTVLRIDSVMKVLTERTDFSGTVLVSDGGRVIYHKAFGFANREWDVRNTTSSRYKLASLGKQFTALLILQLADSGRISLDDPLVKYLPELRAPNAGRILVRHVLSHRSGIPNYHAIPLFDSLVSKRYHTLEQFVGLFADMPLLFEPGTDIQYSNLGYSALALLAERVCGRPFNELLHTRVFAPAGMEDSFTEDEQRIMPHAACGYMNTYTCYEKERYRDPSSVTGSGNVASTTGDLFKYDQALRSGKLLSAKMHKAWVTDAGGGFGLGWMLTRTPVPGGDSLTIAYHDGGNNGFTTVMYRYIEKNASIVVLSNTGAYNIFGVSSRINRALLGREVPPIKKQLISDFAKVLESEGLEAASRLFRANRSNSEYELDGGAFNVLGYNFLRKGRLDVAVRIFELNVEAFPEEANAYDSVAEGYMSQGRKSEAIVNYQRSLTLDPNNANARVMLRKLREQEGD